MVESTYSEIAVEPALRRLDDLIMRAVQSAAAAYGPEAAADPYRGLHIGPPEVAQLLASDPGRPEWSAGPEHGPLACGETFDWLAQAFDLSPFDLDVLVVALAPEVDRRYERLYAYLQDDVTRTRPTVDLALALLCTSSGERGHARARFVAEAPLLRHGLLHLLPDARQPQSSLLAHFLQVDEQIVSLLTGLPGLDRRIAPFCQEIRLPALARETTLADERWAGLAGLVQAALTDNRALRLYFHGLAGLGQMLTAALLAKRLDRPLLLAELQHIPSDLDLDVALRLVFRAAWLSGALLYLEGLDDLRRNDEDRRELFDALATQPGPGVVILAGAQAWSPGFLPLGVTVVPFDLPDAAGRLTCWQTALESEGVVLQDADLEALAHRFRLTPVQIADAVACATNNAVLRHPEQPSVQPADLFAAARSQSGHELLALARKVAPVHTWDDLVLPPDAVAQLREVCARLSSRDRVLQEWGFARRLSGGKGVNALFAGPSGTGKTMAAEVVAAELGLDLYAIDLSSVVSKYIGETEQNLERVFRAAEGANAILFFDEADALFGKRSEVRDSHDRYANIEISYLLQKMEQYEGLAILASNMHQHLDPAFTRRLAFTVHFPFPAADARLKIWTSVWPPELPLAPGLDFDSLAREHKLSGGNIRNIALAAAFQAAQDGGVVTMEHLQHAARREFQKMGKAVRENGAGDPDEVLPLRRRA